MVVEISGIVEFEEICEEISGRIIHGGSGINGKRDLWEGEGIVSFLICSSF